MATTEFCLLGPIVVRRGTAAVPVQPGKQRVVLAALLLSAGRVVPVDELAEALWGCAPPPSAQVSVRNYVKRLRQTLGDREGGRISTHPHGYLLHLDADELDVTRFEALSAAARTAARSGSWDNAATNANAALSLWRGEPLADVESEILAQRAVPRLTEIRLQTLETRIDADLHLGRHADVITELQQLTDAHPLREHLHAQLLLALYRDGRQAEAFAAYAHARQVLVDELGTEPGNGLRELHQQMLTADPRLAVPQPAPIGAGRAVTAVPRQLPAGARHFVGRADELAALNGMVELPGHGVPGTVVIAAVGGTAGVGKTALAVHWAHQIADRFPDGQLYVNLRGYDPGQPTPAADALAGFLRALGVPGEDIPPDASERAARYRSLLAGQRMLIVLDNARDEQQVRPLLPGTPGCLAVVTSRCELTGLVITEDACPIALNVFSEAEARELLGRRLGAGRVAAEPGAITELTRLCAGLPLALSVTGARAASRPNGKIAAMAAELRDARDRLDRLATGDPASSVRAVFSWSYQNLGGLAARMFRLLGLHPGPDITAPAAASMAGVAVKKAKDALGELTRAHLLTEHVPGRFACHDLLHAYAAEKSEAHISHTERQLALRRLLGHYLHTAYAADRVLYPARPRITLEPLVAATSPENFTSLAQALAWLDAERPVLLAAIRLAADQGFGTCCWQLAWALETFLYRRHRVHDWASAHRTALEAARLLGDRRGEAFARRGIANALISLGDDCQEAYAHLRQALRLRRQLGDQAGQAMLLTDLCRLFEHQERNGQAVRSARQALRLFRGIADRRGEATALNHVGWNLGQLGDYRQALVYCQQAVVISIALGDLHQAVAILDSLGYAHSHLGHHAQAAACYRRSLEINAELGFSYRRAETLGYAGDAHQAAGDPVAAREAWQEGLRILDELRHPSADQFRARMRALSLAGSGQKAESQAARQASRPMH